MRTTNSFPLHEQSNLSKIHLINIFSHGERSVKWIFKCLALLISIVGDWTVGWTVLIIYLSISFENKWYNLNPATTKVFHSLTFCWFYVQFAVFNSVNSVHIWSFSGPHFPAFGLNLEIYRVNIRIQAKCGNMLTRKLRICALFMMCYRFTTI